MRLVADIETDGLLDQLSVIHSLCLLDLDSGQQWSCTDHPFEHPEGIPVVTIDEGLRMLMESERAVFHNGIKFDIPAIQKVKPWFSLSRDQIVDTLIMSRLIHPELRDEDLKRRNKDRAKLRKKVAQAGVDDERQWIEDQLKLRFPGNLIGSHGLEAWGYRLGEWKGDYSKEMKEQGRDPWTHWNKEMQLYCDQDVVVTAKLLRQLLRHKYAAHALSIERDFAVILAEMERNGFPFDMEKAQSLQHRLMKRRAEIDVELQKAFPPIEETQTFVPKASNSRYGYVKGEPFTKRWEVKFNPGSRQHIARWLKNKYGWKPQDYTETGQPVVDEKVLSKLKFPEAKLLAEYFLLDKRLGMLEGKSGGGLIKAARQHGDGRIHGSVTTCGAVTRRCTHSSPNMAQLPATSVPYGHEFRELMYAPRGWKLLGWDASGLELRCFAHYMARYDGGAYIQTVLSGDIHWTHSKALGLVGEDEDRDDGNETHLWARNKVAKRFIYAFLYGAGAETIGEIVEPNGSAAAKKKAGKKLIDTFLKRTPALARLKQDIAKAVAKRGKLKAIDGGDLFVRSEHSALNTLLQSAGAIAVKVATILFYDLLVERGYRPGTDFQIVAHVHDEVQTLVKEGLEDAIGEIAREAMSSAGEALGFQCPLAADFQHGRSWADTH